MRVVLAEASYVRGDGPPIRPAHLPELGHAMIDPRSREHLEHPFPGVDGEHVFVTGPGSWAGLSGQVMHQVEHGITGVVCRVRMLPGGDIADLPASRLVFMPEDQRPRDLRSALNRTRATPSPRFIVVPTAWGVFDRRTSHTLDDHRELTYEAAEMIADGLNHGDNDVREGAPPAP